MRRETPLPIRVFTSCFQFTSSHPVSNSHLRILFPIRIFTSCFQFASAHPVLNSHLHILFPIRIFTPCFQLASSHPVSNSHLQILFPIRIFTPCFQFASSHPVSNSHLHILFPIRIFTSSSLTICLNTFPVPGLQTSVYPLSYTIKLSVNPPSITPVHAVCSVHQDILCLTAVISFCTMSPSVTKHHTIMQYGTLMLQHYSACVCL
jgi:hypothetical protein